MAGPAKKPASKAAAKPKKKAYSVTGLYEVSGDTLKRLKRSCPKCGDGVYLASHANRSTCGKCGYVEFKK